MDHEDLIGIMFAMIVVIFMFTWPFNPLNPQFNLLPGMVATKEQIFTYFVAIMGVVTIVFLWIWFTFDDRVMMKGHARPKRK